MPGSWPWASSANGRFFSYTVAANALADRFESSIIELVCVPGNYKRNPCRRIFRPIAEMCPDRGQIGVGSLLSCAVQDGKIWAPINHATTSRQREWVKTLSTLIGTFVLFVKLNYGFFFEQVSSLQIRFLVATLCSESLVHIVPFMIH